MSADFQYVEIALAARESAVANLEAEMSAFKPLSRGDYHDYRSQQIDQTLKLNPDRARAEIEKSVDEQLEVIASPEYQFSDQFDDRFMGEFVTGVFLCHALCEALINAILALGFAHQKTPELFQIVEKAGLKEKWLWGPKAFCPTYELPSDGALYESLQRLIKVRNALVHYKVTLQVENEIVLTGSKIDQRPISEQLKMLKRFFALPYELEHHARAQIAHPKFSLLYYPLNNRLRAKMKRSS